MSSSVWYIFRNSKYVSIPLESYIHPSKFNFSSVCQVLTFLFIYLAIPNITSGFIKCTRILISEVRIYKRKQESKKKRKNVFLFSWSLSWSKACFLVFLFFCFLLQIRTSAHLLLTKNYLWIFDVVCVEYWMRATRLLKMGNIFINQNLIFISLFFHLIFGTTKLKPVFLKQN